MPTLDFAILSEYAKADHGGAGPVNIIGGGIDTVDATDFPVHFNLSITLRVGFTRSECGRPHNAEILFMDTDGARMVKVTGTIVPEWDESRPTHWQVHEPMVLNFGATVEEPSTNQVVILINDTEQKSIPFRVRSVTGQGGDE